MPDLWAQDIGNPTPLDDQRQPLGQVPDEQVGDRPGDRQRRSADGVPQLGEHRGLREGAARPSSSRRFEQQGYCWVVVGSTQRGRAEAQPEVVPRALEYYRELESRSKVAHEVSPYAKGEGPVKFNFDWTFDYYPLAYTRPGPEMTIYRLQGGQCARR